MLTTHQEAKFDEIGASMCNWLRMLRAQKAKPGHVQTETDEVILYNMEIVIGDLLALKQSMQSLVPGVTDNISYHNYCLSLLDATDNAVCALSSKLDREQGEDSPRALLVNDTLSRLADVRENWMR